MYVNNSMFDITKYCNIPFMNMTQVAAAAESLVTLDMLTNLWRCECNQSEHVNSIALPITLSHKGMCNK